MRLGLLADIHGDLRNLNRALDALRAHEVDRFVVLGDVIYDRRNATETVDLLRGCRAVGVWGNHDLGLALDPSESLRERFSQSVIDFFAGLTAHYEIDDVLIAHSLPHQDPTDPAEYYLGSRPNEEGAVEESLNFCEHRRVFIGHFHSWFVGSSAGIVEWSAEEPLELSPELRYVIVVHAVMNGWTAVYDAAEDLLIPIRL